MVLREMENERLDFWTLASRRQEAFIKHRVHAGVDELRGFVFVVVSRYHVKLRALAESAVTHAERSPMCLCRKKYRRRQSCSVPDLIPQPPSEDNEI